MKFNTITFTIAAALHLNGVKAFLNGPKVRGEGEEIVAEVKVDLGAVLDFDWSHFDWMRYNWTDPEAELGNHIGCPHDDRFPQGCEMLMPPYPKCLEGDFVDWVHAAMIEGGPDCCGEDRTACKCPIKDSILFESAVADFCEEVQICADAYELIMSTEQIKKDLDQLKEYQIYEESNVKMDDIQWWQKG